MRTENEIDLVEKIRTNMDTASEEKLIVRYNTRIIRQVRHKLGASNQDWEDLVSEIKMAVLISLREGKFDVSKGTPLGSYIYGVTINKLKDYFKLYKQQKQTTSDLEPDSLINLDIETNLEKKELHDILIKILSSLEIKFQEVLYLRFYEGLSISKISKKIDLPPKRVSERIHYALKLLRKKCKKEKFLSIFWTFSLILL